jgi:hypothetical protein
MGESDPLMVVNMQNYKLFIKGRTCVEDGVLEDAEKVVVVNLRTGRLSLVDGKTKSRSITAELHVEATGAL